MALFEYKCRVCGKIFEKLCRVSEENDCEMVFHDCDGTEGSHDHYGIGDRIPSTTSLKFVGNGFYVNDYKRKN